ncbi:MAG: ferritin-like domain-containing protein, partial [Archangium sp.]
GAAAIAFEALSREVEAHGVHGSLVSAARRAAHEERRHTRLVGALAHARGGRFTVRGQPHQAPRSLEALALENAREGCVRETLGAMVGLYQSQHAADAEVRRVMAHVSADELGHAAWSHALAESLESRLTLSQRRRVRAAREEALTTAAAELAGAVDPGHAKALGMPDADRLHDLARTLI